MRDFHLPGRSAVYATGAMAATSMPAATLTALDVLRAGGNALDAAVAAVAVLGVIEPQSTGIGGDCFCLYAPAGTGEVIAMNGSGRAAAAATIQWYEDRQIRALENTSAHTVTIPGAVSAWQALLAAHGRKGLDELLQPAIRFAAEGWPVHPKVAWDWERSVDKLQKNGAHAFLPGGQAPKGGLQTEADFAAGLHGAEFVTPIHASWNGYEVYQCPPNGSGLLVLMLLGILQGLGDAPDGPLGTTRLHRHAEAARLVYRDRDAFLADPAQADVPVQRLTSPAYLAALRGLIRDDRAMRDLPAPGEALLPPHRDTVYLCVVDRDGNACSFINSLFQAFGSGILDAASGVMLHNRGFGFRVQRGHPNCIAPGKRPMHTIIPGMVMQKTPDGGQQAVMPFGVMGGHFQPMGQSLFLTNLLQYGLDIQQAIDLPRLFPYAGKLEVERGIPSDVVDRLARLGHQIAAVERPHGGGQAIWIDRARGCLIGGSDPRKDGMALGY